VFERFRGFLLQERGMAAGSVRLYGGIARLFLAERPVMSLLKASIRV
jgi:hypothetical protein